MKTEITDFYMGPGIFEEKFKKLIERYDKIIKKCKAKKINMDDIWQELERIDPENDKEFE